MRRYSLFIILIFLLSSNSWASLTIRRLFVLPGSDDVQNTIAPELDQSLKKHLNGNSRFEVIQNEKVATALQVDEKNYYRVVLNPEVHAKAARLTGADTTVVVHIKHIGDNLNVQEDWRRADGSVLFSEVRSISARLPIQEQQKKLYQITEAIINRIPYKGAVTGRTGDTITIDLNSKQVSEGDLLYIGRETGEKTHPLLKTLINVDYAAVGTAEVTSTDGILGFAKVKSETEVEPIGIDHKITKIDKPIMGSKRDRKKPESLAKQENHGENKKNKANDEDQGPWDKLEKYQDKNTGPLDDGRLTSEADKKRPRYASVGARVNTGSIGHRETLNGQAIDISGFGLGAGFFAEGWITKNWIIALSYDFLTGNLKGKNASTDISEGGTSWNKFDLYGGYRYLTEDDLSGTNLIFGFGYESIHMNLPLDSSNGLGKKSYSGILFMVIGDIPLNFSSRVEIGLGIQPFASLGETEYITGTADSASVINISGKWLTTIADNLWFTAGLDYSSSSGSFQNGKNLTDKRFSISPGIKYSF